MEFTHLVNLRNPKYLYKYRSLSGVSRNYALDIIRKRKLFFAKSTELNDPYDCAPRIKLIDNSTGKFLYIDLTDNEIQFQLERLDMQRHGVLSLSAIYDSILMWSHYADNHRGVCYQFRTDNEFFGYAQRVNYKARRPVIKREAANGAERALLTKADFWAYENEWRILCHPDAPIGLPQCPGIAEYPASALTGIIFGSKIGKIDRDEIISILEGLNRNVNYYRAELDGRLYKINIKDESKQRS